jgi:hypothetical protein
MIFARYKLERLSELIGEQWGDLRIPGLLQLIGMVKPKRVLEIGAYMGVSTEVFLLHAEHVTTIDPWLDPQIYSQFLARVGGYPHLKHIRGRSPGAVPYPSEYDFVYIDGDHSYQAVLADIKIARTVNPKWIGGHDYMGKDTPDVERAVSYVWPSNPPFVFSDSSWALRTP